MWRAITVAWPYLEQLTYVWVVAAVEVSENVDSTFGDFFRWSYGWFSCRFRIFQNWPSNVPEDNWRKTVCRQHVPPFENINPSVAEEVTKIASRIGVDGLEFIDRERTKITSMLLWNDTTPLDRAVTICCEIILNVGLFVGRGRTVQSSMSIVIIFGRYVGKSTQSVF